MYLKDPVILGAILVLVGLGVYVARVSHQSQEFARSVLAKQAQYQASQPKANSPDTRRPARPQTPSQGSSDSIVPPRENPRDLAVVDTFRNGWGLAFDMPRDGSGKMRTDFGGKMKITTIVFGPGSEIALHIYAYSGNASKAQVMTYLYEEANIAENKWMPERSPYSLATKGFSEELMFTGKDLGTQMRFEVVYAKNKTGRFQYLFMWETSDNDFSKYKGLMNSFYNSVRGQR